jgi:Putative DnaT-like ssDNA binding protein
MALTVEDGTGIVDADSYVTVAELDAFAAARGVTTLPALDADKEVLLRLAFDYVEAHRGQFQGVKTYEGNSYSQFPRENLYVDGEEVGPAVVPREAKRAQMQLAIDADDATLSPNGTGRAVIREKLDVLETEYEAGQSPSPQPVFTKANQWLRPLFGNSGMPHTLRV